jgi:2-methylcitrate dehydratase PrpD
VHGSVRLNAFTPERMSDPAVREMMKKIVCVADPVFSKGYPNQRASQVDIETVDGRKLGHFQPYRKGDPELPLTDDELNAKFMELAGPVLGERGAKRLLEQLWMLEKLAAVEFEILTGDVQAAG